MTERMIPTHRGYMKEGEDTEEFAGRSQYLYTPQELILMGASVESCLLQRYEDFFTPTGILVQRYPASEVINERQSRLYYCIYHVDMNKTNFLALRLEYVNTSTLQTAQDPTLLGEFDPDINFLDINVDYRYTEMLKERYKDYKVKIKGVAYPIFRIHPLQTA